MESLAAVAFAVEPPGFSSVALVEEETAVEPPPSAVPLAVSRRTGAGFSGSSAPFWASSIQRTTFPSE